MKYLTTSSFHRRYKLSSRHGNAKVAGWRLLTAHVLTAFCLVLPTCAQGEKPTPSSDTQRPWPAFQPTAGSGLALPPVEESEDFRIISAQAQESYSRYLVGEEIKLQLPRPNQLISLGGKLPPIRLEATYTRPVALKEVLAYALENNLDIRIQNANVASNRWLAVGAFGGYLPDILMSFQEQLLAGSSLIGGVIPVTFHTPNTQVSAGFRYFGFQGGRVTFGSLQALHTYKASKHQLRATVNDVLTNITKAYYGLLRHQALLQIQTRAVEVSRAQVVLNQQLERAGTGTKFQVLQSDTQLARDEQNLLQQEVQLRNAAIELATALNLNSAANLLSAEAEVKKVRLIDPSMDINRLISIAVLNRPELKQYQDLRIAARRNIQVQAAPLYPQFQFFGNANGTGATLRNNYVVQPGSFSTVPLNVTASALGLAPFSGTSTAPVFLAGQVFTPAQRVSRRVRLNYALGIQVNWNYPQFGVPTLANVMSAKALARRALLQSNQQLLAVLEQVRKSYLASQTAERQIEVTTKGVISAVEELRLSRVRLANGVGTNIDVINAQRDFTQALVNKADAIITFNIAQAQLLRDIGLISYDTLTSGRLLRQ